MKYEQLLNHIQNLISESHLQCGDKIPSIREMSTSFQACESHKEILQ